MGDGIDLAFVVPRRAERGPVIEEGAEIPITIPGVLLDGDAERLRRGTGDHAGVHLEPDVHLPVVGEDAGAEGLVARLRRPAQERADPGPGQIRSSGWPCCGRGNHRRAAIGPFAPARGPDPPTAAGQDEGRIRTMSGMTYTNLDN